MPDPQLTREWTPIVTKHLNPDTNKMVNDAGKAERDRKPVELYGPEGGPSREYAASMEGGEDELARATKIVDIDGVMTIVPDDEFAERAAEHQARNAAVADLGLEADQVNAADRQALIDEMQPTITEEDPPEVVADEEPDDTAESTEAEVREMFGGESEEADSPE